MPNIGELTAAAALATTDRWLVAQGDDELKRSTLQDLLALFRPGFVFGGKLIGADFNSTADQAIPIVSPTTRYAIFRHYVINPSTSLTVAKGSLYIDPAKGGPIINATTTAFTTAQTAALDAANNAAGIAVSNNVVTDNSTIYLSLTTPQGAPATADVYVYIIPFW